MPTPGKVGSLSRASSLRSALPLLVIPPRYTPPSSSPLSAPPLPAPPCSFPPLTPISTEPPPVPPPTAISPYRHTPILSRFIPLSPLHLLSPTGPMRFLQVRSLRSEFFTIEFLLVVFPMAVRVWASTGPGIVAARIEFESEDVAAKVLEQYSRDTWGMNSFGVEMERKREGNRWWEGVNRAIYAKVKDCEV